MALELSLPVDPVEIRIVEVVALESPSIDEELPEVLPNVDGIGPAREIDAILAGQDSLKVRARRAAGKFKRRHLS